MNWLEGFIYGLISGITEFLPVSSQAHQKILRQLFGTANDPVMNLIVHLSAVIALFFACRGLMARMRREQAIQRRGRKHSADVRASYDLRLVRTAIVPMLLLMLLMILSRNWLDNGLLIAVFSVINGLIIFASERFPHGNKDSRHMSVLDAIGFGVAGAFSVFPGISRVGASQSLATMRGVDRQQSMNWALLLSIPALLMLCVFDIVAIVGSVATALSFAVIVGYITASIGALVGTYLCVMFIRSVIGRMNMAGFAYYSWGVALFVFVLYLIS